MRFRHQNLNLNDRWNKSYLTANYTRRLNEKASNLWMSILAGDSIHQKNEVQHIHYQHMLEFSRTELNIV